MARNQLSKTMSSMLNQPIPAFVESHIDENGTYDRTSEYIRDLNRKGMKYAEQERFDALKLELQYVFLRPDSEYESLADEDIFNRNRKRLSI